MALQATTEIDFSRFNAGMAGFVSKLGIESVKVVRKETGELIKSLVRLTPAADSKKITSFLTNKFDTLADERNSSTDWNHGGGKAGSGGMIWFCVTSNYLIGVAPEKDMRGASVDELKRLSYQTTKGGKRLNVPIRNHKHQRALIHQTILTKASTVKKLIAAKIKNRGRLKAGWLAAVFGNSITLDGGSQPPEYVMRHRGNGGYFIDELGRNGFPSFTIANTSAGVGSKTNNLNWLVQRASDIRAKAMQTNLSLYLRGKKFIGDYA